MKISTLTLPDWRDNRTINYIQIKGKILYRQSDILELLNV